MSIGSTFNSKVMAQASPASPAPKRANMPSTIRKVTSIEPRRYKYTYCKCQNMTIGCFDAIGAFFLILRGRGPPGFSRMSSPRRRGSPFVFRAPPLRGLDAAPQNHARRVPQPCSHGYGRAAGVSVTPGLMQHIHFYVIASEANQSFFMIFI